MHARPGAEVELFEAACEEFGGVAGTLSIRGHRRGWFGPHFPAPMNGRLGDVVIAPFKLVSLLEKRFGPFNHLSTRVAHRGQVSFR